MTPPIIEGAIVGIEGSEVTLNFTVTKAIPAVNVEDILWFFRREGGEIEDITSFSHPQFNFSSDRLFLTITQLSYSNEGTYTLTASNKVGNASASVVLDIQGTCYCF